TIRNTWIHLLKEEIFVASVLKADGPGLAFNWDVSPSFSELRMIASDVGRVLIEAAAHSKPSDMLLYQRQGKPMIVRAGALWVQLISQGVEHRTNIGAILKQLNVIPPEIDGWGYMLGNVDIQEGVPG